MCNLLVNANTLNRIPPRKNVPFFPPGALSILSMIICFIDKVNQHRKPVNCTKSHCQAELKTKNSALESLAIVLLTEP